MDDNEEGNKAVAELNGTEFMGREVVVNEAKPRKEY